MAVRYEGAHPLDNAKWHALTGRQARFALGNDWARRYQPGIAPFLATRDFSAELFAALSGLIDRGESAAIATLEEMAPPPGLAVAHRDLVLQMIWQGEAADSPKLEPVMLGADDVPEMLALVDATRPGPFGPRTVELGTYLGIRREGRLAAMAGERIKLDGFTEISGVSVDRDYRGHGLAAELVRRLITLITARGETPFLHVFASNNIAVALYRKLGFIERRPLHLLMLERPR